MYVAANVAVNTRNERATTHDRRWINCWFACSSGARALAAGRPRLFAQQQHARQRNCHALGLQPSIRLLNTCMVERCLQVSMPFSAF